MVDYAARRRRNRGLGGAGFTFLATFTAPNGTDLVGHVCDSGQAFAVLNGSYEIHNNAARSTGISSIARVVWAADGSLMGTVLNPHPQAGYIVRAFDKDNYIVLLPTAPLTGFEVYRVQAGGFNLIASGACAWTNPSEVRWSRSGNIHNIYVNDVQIVNGLVESYQAAQAGVGFLGPADVVERFDFMRQP